MNRLKLHGIVEQIRAQPGFAFDVEDVEENLNEVLDFFGVGGVFSADETDILRQEMMDLALGAEFAEAVRMTDMEVWNPDVTEFQ